MPVKSPRDTVRALKLALSCSVAMKSLGVAACCGRNRINIYVFIDSLRTRELIPSLKNKPVRKSRTVTHTDCARDLSDRKPSAQ